jgi:hypothetical protein
VVGSGRGLIYDGPTIRVFVRKNGWKSTQEKHQSGQPISGPRSEPEYEVETLPTKPWRSAGMKYTVCPALLQRVLRKMASVTSVAEPWKPMLCCPPESRFESRGDCRLSKQNLYHIFQPQVVTSLYGLRCRFCKITDAMSLYENSLWRQEKCSISSFRFSLRVGIATCSNLLYTHRSFSYSELASYEPGGKWTHTL